MEKPISILINNNTVLRMNNSWFFIIPKLLCMLMYLECAVVSRNLLSLSWQYYNHDNLLSKMYSTQHSSSTYMFVLKINFDCSGDKEISN